MSAVGLHERPFLFADLPVNQWEIVPYDVFHLMVIGLLTLLLSIFCSSLTPNAGSTQNYVSTQTESEELPPATSSNTSDIKLAGPLGQDQTTGYQYFTKATVSTRERFAARVALGEWYFAVGFLEPTPPVLYVRVDAIFTIGSEVFCRVQALQDSSRRDPVTTFPIYTSSYPPVDLPIISSLVSNVLLTSFHCVVLPLTATSLMPPPLPISLLSLVVGYVVITFQHTSSS